MNTDQIALLALATSLGSIWISYRAYSETKRVNNAEKRTAVNGIFFGALLKARDLQEQITTALNKSTIEVEERCYLHRCETKIKTTVTAIEGSLDWLETKKPENSTFLEEYKTRAQQLAAMIDNLEPQVRQIEEKYRSNETPHQPTPAL